MSSNQNQITVTAVGGYDEYGRNMTAVQYKDDVVLFDMGIKLDRVLIHEDVVFDETHHMDLAALGAIPDDSVIEKVRGKVRAIVFSHGHLDHIGAVPKLLHRYKAPILATPFTAKLIQDELADERVHPVKADIVPMPHGKRRRVSKDLEIEMVKITHSIIDSAMPVLHTPLGAVVYSNDFKLDNSPVIGAPPDYTRLKQLGQGKGTPGGGVFCLIADSTRVSDETKTESEKIARELLRDFMYGLAHEANGLIVTTFSSHIERLKSICEYGLALDRKVMLLGRSMEKYSQNAAKMGYAPWLDDVEVIGRRPEIDRALRDAGKRKSNTMLVVTGHQGEPDALLSRVAKNETPYKVAKNDLVIFSSNIIPHPLNVANRFVLETRLKANKARIVKGAHVSGHGSREDHWELLNMLKPRHVIPSHGDMKQTAGYIDLGTSFDYKVNDDLHILRNGQSVAMG